MSYDLDLMMEDTRCAHCGRGAEEECQFHMNPTYNLTPIFDLALTREPLPNPNVSEAEVVLFRAATDRPRGLRLLDGVLASESAARLEAALAFVDDAKNREALLALQPSNGWGDLPGAREVLACMLRAARENPGARWRIS